MVKRLKEKAVGMVLSENDGSVCMVLLTECNWHDVFTCCLPKCSHPLFYPPLSCLAFLPVPLHMSFRPVLLL